MLLNSSPVKLFQEKWIIFDASIGFPCATINIMQLKTCFLKIFCTRLMIYFRVSKLFWTSLHRKKILVNHSKKKIGWGWLKSLSMSCSIFDVVCKNLLFLGEWIDVVILSSKRELPTALTVQKTSYGGLIGNTPAYCPRNLSSNPAWANQYAQMFSSVSPIFAYVTYYKWGMVHCHCIFQHMSYFS